MYKSIVKIRSAVLVFLTHSIALPILKIVRKPQVFPYSKEQLLQMPNGTLGRELINMLATNNLQLLSYYAKHDIKHILLDYDTTDKGEVCLQCFMLGNGHISFPVFITVVFGFVTIPEHWKSFIEAYKKGRGSNSIESWKWFEILHEPVFDLQQRIQNKNTQL
jgi:ubiquinone biosynthesis protein Coq4